MNRRTLACTAALVAVLGAGTACQPTETNGTGSKTTATATSGTGSNDSKTVAKKTVPNFVGMGLQSAQDAAQKQGFYALKSHDSLGRGRFQAFDRNWKVCSQNYKAGKVVPTDTELDFGSVKLDETCPAKDQSAPSAAGGTMPDFHGKSVKAARAALDSSTSITVNDASSDDRMVLIESNWQVCTQKPAAGAKLAGQPVEFTAVKYGETCP
ncbi:hypothetical protein GCM10018980_51740 [Streptomyces capoamus]|uniref:PASTA domain-containing protein n=1 Tax=Streptomyces capoamus TaxID=68183 RepID=A0A919KE40_9ACTN|nr:PASTA domain-containing protein [Streptomyces capoamus]GGW15762.1 hypothetical protein GCM10010501_29070 [Streptomyces libani subsp. rufus]GHG62095.1 hypothetical protein GCM10018980_51740 [Streptomyces capoamus]